MRQVREECGQAGLTGVGPAARSPFLSMSATSEAALQITTAAVPSNRLSDQLGYHRDGSPRMVEVEAKLLPERAGSAAAVIDGVGLCTVLALDDETLALIKEGDNLVNPAVPGALLSAEVWTAIGLYQGGLVVRPATDPLTIHAEHDDRQRRSRVTAAERERRESDRRRREVADWEALPLEERTRIRLEQVGAVLADVDPARFGRFLDQLPRLLGRLS